MFQNFTQISSLRKKPKTTFVALSCLSHFFPIFKQRLAHFLHYFLKTWVVICIFIILYFCASIKNRFGQYFHKQYHHTRIIQNEQILLLVETMSKQLSDSNLRHLSSYVMQCFLALKFSTLFRRLSDEQKNWPNRNDCFSKH